MAAPFDIPFDTQLAFLWNELTGKENRTLKAFRGNNQLSPSGYAKQFEQLYERAGGSGMDARMNNASMVFEQMQNEVPDLPQNVVRAYRFLTDKGLSGAQASGIVGNLMAESYPELRANAFNPEGGGQGAYGIAQWRGSRLDDLNAFAKANMPQEAGPPLTAKMNGKKPMSLLSFFQPDNKGQTLKDRLMKRDPNTGLNFFGRVGASLDPLVLQGTGMGQQIREQGLQRAALEKNEVDINYSINFLRAKSQAGDAIATRILGAVEQKLMTPKDAITLYYSEVSKLGGVGKERTKMIADARKEFTGLQRVKDFDKVANAYGRISASVKEPSAAGDLSLIFNYMKMLDPQSVVREGEFAAAAAAGGYGERIAAMVQKLKDGTLLTAVQRADFVDRANKLYSEAESLYDNTRDQYITYATEAGFDPNILPDFRYSGEKIQKPTILQVPPRPDSFNGDDAAWVTEWQSQTEQWRKEYLEALDG